MDETMFYLLAGALVLAALAASAVGIRWVDSFPTRQAMIGLTICFALLVSGTATFAVLSARAEQEHREEELAEEQAEAEEGAEAAGAAAQPAESVGEQPAAENTFELTSPPDGSLVFEPDSLQTGAGPLTMLYTNPSAVPHNVAVEDVEEQLLGESETITESETELQVELVPGEFIFFCTIPGHREAGMEGTITVE